MDRNFINKVSTSLEKSTINPDELYRGFLTNTSHSEY